MGRIAGRARTRRMRGRIPRELHRRMVTGSRPDRTGRHDEGMVQAQYFNRRPATGSQSNDKRAVLAPCEVLPPGLPSGWKRGSSWPVSGSTPQVLACL